MVGEQLLEAVALECSVGTSQVRLLDIENGCSVRLQTNFAVRTPLLAVSTGDLVDSHSEGLWIRWICSKSVDLVCLFVDQT